MTRRIPWSTIARGALACLCLGAAALLPLSGRAQDGELGREQLTVESLMAAVAKSRGLVSAFTETKQLALLDSVLESRGTVYFMPPDRFARITETPAKTSLVLNGDRLRIRDAAGADDIMQLDPRAREFVGALIVLLRGDLGELRKRYDAAIDGSGRQWNLRLVPRGALVRRLIQAITLSGTGRRPTGILVEETGGDRTTTVFVNADLDHEFSAAEQEQLFAVGPG